MQSPSLDHMIVNRATFPVGSSVADRVQAAAQAKQQIALLLLLPIGLYMVFYPVLRPLGEAVLFATLLFCALSAIVAGRLHVPVGLGILLAGSLPILFLSLSDAMPTAWTRYHSDFAVLRHWSWIPIALLVLNNARFFWYKCFPFIQKNAWKCAIIYYIFTRLALIAVGEVQRIDILLYHVSITTTPVLIFIAIGFLRENRPAWKDFFIFIAVASVMASQTHMLSWIVIYLCRILPGRTLQFTPAVISVALLSFLLIAPQFSYFLHEIDGNTGVRSVLWGHAQTAVIQTFGLGVGFGTEYFPNDFRQLNAGDWILTGESHVDRLYVSTHSALYDTVLRMGIIGFVGFLTWLLKYIRTPLFISRPSDVPLITGMICMVLFILAFNPGFVTIYILMVVMLIMGLVEILTFRSSVADVGDSSLGQT